VSDIAMFFSCFN